MKKKILINFKNLSVVSENKNRNLFYSLRGVEFSILENEILEIISKKKEPISSLINVIVDNVNYNGEIYRNIDLSEIQVISPILLGKNLKLNNLFSFKNTNWKNVENYFNSLKQNLENERKSLINQKGMSLSKRYINSAEFKKKITHLLKKEETELLKNNLNFKNYIYYLERKKKLTNDNNVFINSIKEEESFLKDKINVFFKKRAFTNRVLKDEYKNSLEELRKLESLNKHNMKYFKKENYKVNLERVNYKIDSLVKRINSENYSDNKIILKKDEEIQKKINKTKKFLDKYKSRIMFYDFDSFSNNLKLIKKMTIIDSSINLISYSDSYNLILHYILNREKILQEELKNLEYYYNFFKKNQIKSKFHNATINLNTKLINLNYDKKILNDKRNFYYDIKNNVTNHFEKYFEEPKHFYLFVKEIFRLIYQIDKATVFNRYKNELIFIKDTIGFLNKRSDLRNFTFKKMVKNDKEFILLNKLDYTAFKNKIFSFENEIKNSFLESKTFFDTENKNLKEPVNKKNKPLEKNIKKVNLKIRDLKILFKNKDKFYEGYLLFFAEKYGIPIDIILSDNIKTNYERALSLILLSVLNKKKIIILDNDNFNLNTDNLNQIKKIFKKISLETSVSIVIINSNFNSIQFIPDRINIFHESYLIYKSEKKKNDVIIDLINSDFVIDNSFSFLENNFQIFTYKEIKKNEFILYINNVKV